jgi:hypothetical protein
MGIDCDLLQCKCGLPHHTVLLYSRFVWSKIPGLLRDMETRYVCYKAKWLMLLREVISFDYDGNMKLRSIVGGIQSF